jgi:hypothetical protein
MMKPETIKEVIPGRLSGRLLINFIDDVSKMEEGWMELGSNSINDSSVDIIQGLLSGDLENKMINMISIGKGGDLDTTPLHTDTGARVSPDSQETEMRSVLADLSILMTSRTGNDVMYTVLAGREQANSNDINEFGLLSKDRTMMAHFVTEEVGPGGRARKYPKKSFHYLAVRWVVTYVNA